ncbi:hypothetical protein BGZ80_011310 [Entomortierella chlamydospora]|uniref:J domain-containing protein n=1 Tax=Entomortierella chlamydospora TaxID=101097 RepID=A0A9P6MUT5_9FUNG|nr:hypothetical protein BGZ80_011310 [Entomortierella chlamydospora]
MDLDKRILYRTLDVSSTSSKEDVELAYRRFMMRHHPGDEEAIVDPSEDPVVVANVARKILCDPEERKKYDNSFRILAPEAGEGRKLPDCVTFTLFTIFLSFLAIRLYGIVNWNYYVVFVPIWVLDSWLVCRECFFLYLGVQLISRSEVLLDGKLDETSSQLIKVLFKESLKEFLNGLFKGSFNAALTIAFQILIARKANDPSSITASLVFAPYFVLEGWKSDATRIQDNVHSS